MTTTYFNLRDCWVVLLNDNVPSTSQPARVAWYGINIVAAAQLGHDLLAKADAQAAALRRDGDLHDIDSPLWAAMAGDETGTGNVPDELDQVAQWLFDNALHY